MGEADELVVEVAGVFLSVFLGLGEIAALMLDSTFALTSWLVAGFFALGSTAGAGLG